MGLATNHSQVAQPWPGRSTPRRRPLAMACSESGTVIATRWLSGSSAWVSLAGHRDPGLVLGILRPDEPAVPGRPLGHGRPAVVVDRDRLGGTLRLLGGE